MVPSWVRLWLFFQLSLTAWWFSKHLTSTSALITYFVSLLIPFSSLSSHSYLFNCHPSNHTRRNHLSFLSVHPLSRLSNISPYLCPVHSFVFHSFASGICSSFTSYWVLSRCDLALDRLSSPLLCSPPLALCLLLSLLSKGCLLLLYSPALSPPPAHSPTCLCLLRALVMSMPSVHLNHHSDGPLKAVKLHLFSCLIARRNVLC